MHNSRKTCTLSPFSPSFSLPAPEKYARFLESMHTFPMICIHYPSITGEVCTFPCIHAHFPPFLRLFPFPPRRSVHLSLNPCTLSGIDGYICGTNYGDMIKDIYFAAGCFWGAQKYFKLVDGVVGTVVGYANGDTLNPTYKDVYTDATGYAETVHVQYDTSLAPIEFLVSMFFKAIDPLSMYKQGEDIGTRYRTGIYYTDEEDKAAIIEVYVSVEKEYGSRLAVEVQPLKNFYTAEEMHQDYLEKNPEGYCHLPESLFEFARNAGKK